MGEPLIRAARPEDVDALTEIVNLPGVRRGTLRLPYTPRALMEQRVATGDGGPHMLVAVEDGVPLGTGTLIPQRGRRAHVAEIVLMVHDGHVGRGIGDALTAALLDLADNWLGLRRVELSVNVDNDRAIRLYERFGFEHEGTCRGDVLRDGVLVDSHLMARLRDAPPRG